MPSNATSIAWINQHQRKVRRHRGPNRERDKEKRNENQADQRLRQRPGEGPALLYRSAGLREEGRLQPRAVSLADGGLIGGPGRHRAAAGAQQQPGGESLPTGHAPAKPARGHVLHRRRAGRLRAYESARRRVHHATKGRDGLQDRHAERHLRQPYSAHPTGTLLKAAVLSTLTKRGRQGEEDDDDRSRAVRAGSGQRGASTEGRRKVDAHSRQRTAPLAGKSLAGAYRPGASARVGSLRRRWEPGHGWNHGEAHLGASTQG